MSHGEIWFERSDEASAERADQHDGEWERLERDLDERARHLPCALPQMSPLARMVELHGMSPRDPDLPTGVLDEAA